MLLWNVNLKIYLSEELLSMVGSQSLPFKRFFLHQEKGFEMCVVAQVFRKTRDGRFVKLSQGVIVGAQARAAVGREVPEGEAATPVKKKPIRLLPKFGDSVDAYAQSKQRCGQRTCRVPSLVR